MDKEKCSERLLTQRRAFAALFPPLLQQAPENDVGDVDIGVEDIALPPLEQAVDAALYRALQRWNALEPATLEAALPYGKRVRRARDVVRWALYESGALSSGDDDDAASERSRCRRGRKRRERMRRRRQQLLDVFATLPEVDTLRAAREPSARLCEFAATFTAKTRALQQKRSMGDTKTHASFEFARPAPSLALAPPTRVSGTDNDQDARAAEQQQEAAAAAARSVAQQNSLLLARGIDVAAHSDPSAGATAEELVIWLDVLHPSKDPGKTQSFLVRESQTLADVIDLVVCAYDQRLSDHARQSKLVYFDSKFYADGRSPDNVDYADEIRAWIRKSPERCAKYGAVSEGETSLAMETTAFRDLPLKIDLPGVYIHQGECEHLIRIRDARLPHELDAPSRGSTSSTGNVFPMRLPNPHHRALRNCFICQQYSAKYICYGDRLGISDPMFYCERCYRVAHFDRNGELVYRDFQSFPYIQD